MKKSIREQRTSRLEIEGTILTNLDDEFYVTINKKRKGQKQVRTNILQIDNSLNIVTARSERVICCFDSNDQK